MPHEQHVSGELRERFYRSVAETLSLLHTATTADRRETLLEVSRILADTMDLPLVWIGWRSVAVSGVEILAAAGSAAAYAATLRLSNDASEPGGTGPVGMVLREGVARVTSVTSEEFSPWQEAACQYGFGACIVAASRTQDEGQLVLVAYSRREGPALGAELLDWEQRLVDELSRFWDHQVLLERSRRMSRYRDAQRSIQRALLEQPDPSAVYQTLARALAGIAGAAAVDVLAGGGADETLQRMALIGPLAALMSSFPLPPMRSESPARFVSTLAIMKGKPVVRCRGGHAVQDQGRWLNELLEHAGAVGVWPLFESPGGLSDGPRLPVGVFVVVTHEVDAFDDEMCRLLDEVADAAGLALHQHVQRHGLLAEQERQTYLASHDDLTSLPNRRALDRHLETLLTDAQRCGRRLAVGLLDLDDLKPINDSHGHAVGDRILVEMADRLRKVLRDVGYVARIGGDEFVLVFENLEHETELDDLLQRIGTSLQQPMTIGSRILSVGASLGIALYASHTPASGEQLLRRADQAMYRVKSRKHHRSRWWAMASTDGVPESAVEPDQPIPPYGAQAAAVLGEWHETWLPRLPEIVEGFCAAMLDHAGVRRLLDVLPEVEFRALKGHLLQHLKILTRGDLDQAGHHDRALRTGAFHAACGLEEVWLLEATEQFRDQLVMALGHADRWALQVVLQRLDADRQWQLESMRDLQRQRVALLARLNALTWSAEGYLELIQGAVDILETHREISACAVGRPDTSGQLTYEAVAGDAFAQYLRALTAGRTLSIRVDANHPEGAGPSGRAWRTVSIQHCAHFGSDPLMLGWRDIVRRLGVVSSVAVPLCPAPLQPAVVLSIYSPYAGGFQSEDQRAFLEQIRSVLDLALARLAPPRPGTELMPFFVRERWRSLIETDALQMHYQPLMRLSDRKVTEFEALARLRDDNDELLSPARFLPALSPGDLIVLFRQGLAQAAACRESLQRSGFILDMSVNAPAAALQDLRYAAAATAVIASSGCPPQALLLEILESPMGTEYAAMLEDPAMQSLKALGVRLVEDDLGAGYSSLIRLRQWPFDRIKIDQAIVLQVRQDPLGTLRFMRQLIRIGHELRMEVVVEGLESFGLIEAATILGADFGQGYALARPMPPESIAGWLTQFQQAHNQAAVPTALGALAGALRWEERFLALPPEPSFWLTHAHARCHAADYLHAAQCSEALMSAHQEMHEAATKGPADPDYRDKRQTFIGLLTQRALEGETA